MSLWWGGHGARQELAGWGAGEEEGHPCGDPRSWQSWQRSSGNHREAAVAWIWLERTLPFWSLAPVEKHDWSVIYNQDIMTSVNGKDRELTFSAFGAMGEPEGGLLPWVSVPESRLSGGFRHVLVLPTVGQPVSLARVQTGHSQCVAKEEREPMTEVV